MPEIFIARPGKTQRDHESGSWARRLVNRRIRGDWSRQVHSLSVAGRNSTELALEGVRLSGKRHR